MKFPIASGEDLEHGWKFDVDFLKRIKSAAACFYETDTGNEMEIEQIQSILIALLAWQALSGGAEHE